MMLENQALEHAHEENSRRLSTEERLVSIVSTSSAIIASDGWWAASATPVSAGQS